MQCSNNLKQIGLAMHTYHASHDTLPWNALYPWPPNSWQSPETYLGPSWLSLILPQLGQQALFDQIEFGQPYNWTNSSGAQPNLLAAQTVVGTFRCPSDGNAPTGRAVGPYQGKQNFADCAWWINIVKPGVTNYKGCSGSNWSDPFWIESTSGPNAYNYNGCDNGNGVEWRNWGGGITPVQPALSFDDIKDGLSLTFAVGEDVVGRNAYNGWRNTDGCLATCAIPLNYYDANDPTLYSDDYERNYSFASLHPGGGNFAMCDGSVHFVNDMIDIGVYRGLATVGAGETVPLPNN